MRGGSGTRRGPADAGGRSGTVVPSRSGRQARCRRSRGRRPRPGRRPSGGVLAGCRVAAPGVGARDGVGGQALGPHRLGLPVDRGERRLHGPVVRRPVVEGPVDRGRGARPSARSPRSSARSATSTGSRLPPPSRPWAASSRTGSDQVGVPVDMGLRRGQDGLDRRPRPCARRSVSSTSFCSSDSARLSALTAARSSGSVAASRAVSACSSAPASGSTSPVSSGSSVAMASGTTVSASAPRPAPPSSPPPCPRRSPRRRPRSARPPPPSRPGRPGCGRRARRPPPVGSSVPSTGIGSPPARRRPRRRRFLAARLDGVG